MTTVNNETSYFQPTNPSLEESMLGKNGNEYPRTLMQYDSMVQLIKILERVGISEELLKKIKEELHFKEEDTYPDGCGNPLEDIKKLF